MRSLPSSSTANNNTRVLKALLDADAPTPQATRPLRLSVDENGVTVSSIALSKRPTFAAAAVGASTGAASSSSTDAIVGASSSNNGAASKAPPTAWADVEVVLHLLPSDEQLSIDSIVLGLVTLDAAAAAASTRTIAVQAAWEVPMLIDSLSSLCGIPRRQLAIAKLPQAGAVRRPSRRSSSAALAGTRAVGKRLTSSQRRHYC